MIWKESRFNPGAVSPVGAQGIAQFMPGTARIRGLKDPFDPEQALEASASFLADLRHRFGSWGLAAAGYNGGPNRVPRFVAGEGGLPYETIDYVFSITGRSADYWAGRARTAAERAASGLSAVEQPSSNAPTIVRVAQPTPTEIDLAMALAERAPIRPASRERTYWALAISIAANRLAQRESVSGKAAKPDEIAAALASARAAVERVAEGPPIAALRSPMRVPQPPPPRPDYEPEINCRQLVARLGRARSVPPPSGTSTGWTPWGAQVAGHPQRAIALRQYARIKARLPRDLADKGPNIVVRRFAARGRRPIHAVQFAASSRAEAAALCRRVAQSLVPCVVVKNG
ncbi:lytic transglycosylase domain-containing protein [Acuticoccus kalidii]|uniref:lytic transglycosylase domain-containing protein n=1 Tax=Acuticoccus kalidii TaxID=2910977 RepID=UPI003F71A967